ncbi:alpha-tubulin N-acetyltransferase 1 isoform 1-T1 [Synchiropus picturatus]
MEFPFDINQLFSERVSIIDHNLVGSPKSAGRSDLQSLIVTVVDELGRASAQAQNLPAPITSASKLQCQRHQLYLLKDGDANGGNGVILGYLKIGSKKLFLLDRQGVHVEAEPECALDFYVAESMQRNGYGLELFNFMLQHKSLEPARMAYDRPSPKFLSFLAKHYCLNQSVPQVNNFVVFESFFHNRSVTQLRKLVPKKPEGEIKPYSLTGREAVHQEQKMPPWPFTTAQSAASQNCHSPSRTPRSIVVPPYGDNVDQNLGSPRIERCGARRSQQGLVARCSLYSRHMDGSSADVLDRSSLGLRAAEHAYTSRYLDPLDCRSKLLLLPDLDCSKSGAVRGPTSMSNGRMHLDPVAHVKFPADSLLLQPRDILEKPCWGRAVAVYPWPEWVKQKHGGRSTRPW